MSWSQFSADMAEASYHEGEDTGTDIPQDFRPLRVQTGDTIQKVIGSGANFKTNKLWLVPWLDTELPMWTRYRNRDN